MFLGYASRQSKLIYISTCLALPMHFVISQIDDFWKVRLFDESHFKLIRKMPYLIYAGSNLAITMPVDVLACH